MTVVLWQVLIGSVWGITNALMKQGAAAAQARRRKQEKGPLQPNAGGWLQKRLPLLHDWLTLLLVWEYSLPFAINISVSSFFFLKLKDAPLSLAVPVTNAITFVVTAVTGAGLGEPVDAFYTGLGIALTSAGVLLCVARSQACSAKQHFGAGVVAGIGGRSSFTMDGGGTRMGSRSSTRHGPAAVFNGPVRRWRKSWSPLQATTTPLTSSRLQLYRWTPIGTREDTAEEAAARPVKFMPLFVVVERRKEALRRTAEAAARLKKQEQGGGAEGPVAHEEEGILASDQNVPEGEWVGKDGESGQQAVNFMQVDSKKLPEEHQKSTQEGDVEMLSEESEGSEN